MKFQTMSALTWITVGAIILIIFVAAVTPKMGSHGFKKSNVEREGYAIVFAIKRYHNDRRAFPSNLNDLAPKYLSRLEEVSYSFRRTHEWPASFFNGDIKSPWAYKLNYDKTAFALAVKDYPIFYFSSRTAKWDFYDQNFSDYNKPFLPPPLKTP